MTQLFPIGYATRLVPLAELKRVHLPKMHPEFARRLFAWLEAQGGKFGIGGGWRETQPDKPGFAPAGKSFHQSQTFASGFVGYCAVDLVCVDPGKVHRAPTWAEVPAQGSAAAKASGVHCNVGTPGAPGSEAWHMQPVEIDGYDTWLAAGRPDPLPPPEPEEPEMVRIRIDGYADQMMLVPIANVEALRKMGLANAPLHVATVADAAALARDLGYQLTPLP